MSTENPNTPAVESGAPAGPADHNPSTTTALEEAQQRLQQSREEPALKTVLTVDEILNAPSDLVEETIDVPQWGGAIKIRSLTRAESAAIQQVGIDQRDPGKPKIDFAAMEKAQFEKAVVEPKFRPEEVNVLYHKFGPSFGLVKDAIDRISGTDSKAMKETLESFQTGGSEG